MDHDDILLWVNAQPEDQSTQIYTYLVYLFTILACRKKCSNSNRPDTKHRCNLCYRLSLVCTATSKAAPVE